jgi:hypothetical protein
MYNEEFSFHGRRDKVEELLADLATIQEISDIELRSVSSVNTGILGREPLKQLEVADVVIGIAINLASSVLYDLICKKIDERAKKSGFIRKYREINEQQRKNNDCF